MSLIFKLYFKIWLNAFSLYIGLKNINFKFCVEQLWIIWMMLINNNKQTICEQINIICFQDSHQLRYKKKLENLFATSSTSAHSYVFNTAAVIIAHPPACWRAWRH